MTMPHRPGRERAELALTATFAWRAAPTALFSPALRVQVERILNGVDEVEAALSGLRPPNPAAGAVTAAERVKNALATLSQSLLTARNLAGSQTLLIYSVEAAFSATNGYVREVESILTELDESKFGA